MKLHLIEIEKAFWNWNQSRGLRLSSLKLARNHVRFFIRFLESRGGTLGNYNIDPNTITQKTIADYQAYLCNYTSGQTGKQLGMETRLARLQSLRTFFRFLREMGQFQMDLRITLPPQRRAKSKKHTTNTP